MNIRAKAGGRALGIDLEPGSLLVMSHASLITHEHGIPKTTKAVPPRMSVVFRARPAAGDAPRAPAWAPAKNATRRTFTPAQTLNRSVSAPAERSSGAAGAAPGAHHGGMDSARSATDIAALRAARGR
jgi:hypothetical protein